jgi:hypothetical protein
MPFFKRVIDVATLGSPRPLRRLVAYYVVLGVVTFVVLRFLPYLAGLLTGDRLTEAAQAPMFLPDGLQSANPLTPPETMLGTVVGGVTFGVSTMMVFVSTLALMLPVTWVYMSASPGRKYNQSLVQTMIVLPMVVAGIVLIVQNSLALAFSLAGVVAAVRFRTTLSETRDIVFVFLAIAVGFAAGVHSVMVAVYLSVLFNFVLLLIWRYDFGRNVLEPSAAGDWAGPLATLTAADGDGHAVPDRDLVLALTPTKVDALSDRFERIRGLLGSNGKKPKYDAVVTIRTNKISQAQKTCVKALDRGTKRWKLDEVVTNTGKPSELYYLVKTRKSVPRDALLTDLRSCGNGAIDSADVEIGDALAVEASQEHEEKKAERTRVLEQK